jgi:cytochrome c biogenesis protein CcmG/thiol:disulfide interchange protein DsbE
MRTGALSLLLALAAPAAGEGPRPIVGDPAPPLDLKTPSDAVLPAQPLQGAVTIVDFFTTWCKPCHQALRDLAALRSAEGGTAIQILLIDVGEDPALVRRFLTTAALPAGAQVLLDPGGTTARTWGHDRFPTTFLIDRAGMIRHINRGWGPGYRERLGRWLRAMLAGGGPPK